MTDSTASNPFAPPRAHVADPTPAPTAEMVPATRLSRFLAILIDASPGVVAAIIAVIAAFATMPGLLTGQFDPASLDWTTLGLGILVLGVVLLGWFAWQVVLLYHYGQTVGKKAMGIRVVRMDGSRVTFARFFFLRGGVLSVVRAIAGGIGGALHVRYGNFAGYAVTLVDALIIFGATRRCGHDYIADTQVVTAESSPHATLAGARRA